tara:strand:- start:450 stop:815 length:366 start_codon:yes stop_codon:yes gene_type:complete
MESKELGIEDLVFSNNNGNIQAGNFMIKNSFLEQNLAPMRTQNKHKSLSGGSVSSLFKDLAVPAGLLYLQQTMVPRNYHEKHPEMIESSIFDKLIGLSKDKPERKLTKKVKNKKNRKTRKL